MKRFILGFFILILATGVCFAEMTLSTVTTSLTDTHGSTTINLAPSNSAYTEAFIVGDANFATVSLLANSNTATPNIDVLFEQSPVNTNTGGYSDPNFVAPASVGSGPTAVLIGADTSPNTWFHVGFTPLALTYGRFKILSHASGTAGATSTVQIKFSKQIWN